ncbi:DUF3192 domain-containing protein [Shewanella sp. JNE10-2]|uniref:DUF3192 domain-containing protein n=1 Tax=unclassified Shewanella TaxID=196818 RepID=UPI0020057147|nr:MULTISPECIES: DUF3192 domain-containing protein [unclassified Shewanella]MCK7628334.1 DUF3192 domain-containing protein [Shewanella sp. JNE9-1]MCK7632558.1 DUF3192 domain-containing protein [Shewanella sp. JNE17]MCK7643583.1 DUF3192 domain-containing protein [Shewanella sp. JNE3-1]MCK7648070.1 DUF3192 domain-containing protein [Shewanella sp. JNE8]MCK7651637.1 DUF3192 domain-containing protein [Shewanella sp. JNE4-1]
MKSKTSVIIGSIFAAYVAFVAVIVLVYEPTPDEMNWEDRQAYLNQKVNDLTLGQDITEVRAMLGKADFSEAKTLDTHQLQVLFYRTHHEKSDGITTKGECTPLIFKNNKLIAWGGDTYKQYLDAETDVVSPTAKETETSSKN